MTLDQTGSKVRIDKWLWYARFYKTRSLASKACQRVIEVVAPGERRGPAPEAQQLYVDHSPPRVAKKEVAADIRTAPIAEREAGSGRPTKAERRATDRLRGDE